MLLSRLSCLRRQRPTRVTYLRKYCATISGTYPVVTPMNMAKTSADQVPKLTVRERERIIKCKSSILDHYADQTYPKFQPIPLASKGWFHPKSKGDYFTVYPTVDWNANGKKLYDENVTFDEFGLDRRLIENLHVDNLRYPLEIQRLSIPQILLGQNVKLAAETGCGKTLAYLLPLVHQILNWKSVTNDRGFNAPLGLIVTPSKELTVQIGKQAEMLTAGLNFVTKTIVGGRTKKLMLNPSVLNVDLVVTTLGAFRKLTTNRIYKLEYVRHTVLDEADTLLEDTFQDDVRHFLQKINFGYRQSPAESSYPATAQLTLVSATMPTSLPEVLHEIVNVDSLVHVETKSLHSLLVRQKFMRIGLSQRPMALLKIVKKKASNKIPIIIFSNTAATADFISMFLNEFNVRNVHLNGQMPVKWRRGKFLEFQNNVANVLTTTDAGARGLDTVDVRHVINYEFPARTADYVHRCGRTGRVGSHGDCYVTNFIARTTEILLTQRIERAIRRNKPFPLCDLLQENLANDDVTDMPKDKQERIINNMSPAQRQEYERKVHELSH